MLCTTQALSRSLSGRGGGPQAMAMVRGSDTYPRLCGAVTFTNICGGVLVVADFAGLPSGPGPGGAGIFAFHIHQGDRCAGDAQDPFSLALGHYNPLNTFHPYHAGDMPPLFAHNGCAWLAFVTNRFSIQEIIGRTVIVHGGPDDFTTQPAGNAGARIGCGIIRCV